MVAQPLAGGHGDHRGSATGGKPTQASLRTSAPFYLAYYAVNLGGTIGRRCPENRKATS
jgi:hypothetical protein